MKKQMPHLVSLFYLLGIYVHVSLAQSVHGLESLVSEVSKSSGVLFNETKSRICSASIVASFESERADLKTIVSAAHCLDQKDFIKTEVIFPNSVLPVGGGSFPFFAVESREKLFFCLGGLTPEGQCLSGAVATVEGNLLLGSAGENFGYSSDIVVLRVREQLVEKLGDSHPGDAIRQFKESMENIREYADVHLWALTGSKDLGWSYELQPCPVKELLYGGPKEGAAVQEDTIFFGDCRLRGGNSGGRLYGAREGKWFALGIAVSSQLDSNDRAVFATNERISALSLRMFYFFNQEREKEKSFFDFMKSKEASDDFNLLVSAMKRELELIKVMDPEKRFDSLPEDHIRVLRILDEIAEDVHEKCIQLLPGERILSQEDLDNPAYIEIASKCLGFLREERLFASTLLGVSLDFAKSFPDIYEKTKSELQNPERGPVTYDDIGWIVLRNFSSNEKNTEGDVKELARKYVYLKMLAEDIEERSDSVSAVYKAYVEWKHGKLEVNFLTHPKNGSNGAGI